ncbi:EAL domain-containing protein [Clostridium grantii]|uniref:PAS domain S-box-containing protein n=1 Tax=Clostridium grantii DSM 8605 TaxID=1121316 RepID=A0A1M5W4Z7_9CLOT|nr:EAL domain-containing protein [Clostridium grantii]SHH82518.1 PAS domain S-box-containing protein [Clostridium grantii DSM 8605]
MKNNNEYKFSKNKIALKIISLYFLFGVLWITLSDKVLDYLVKDVNTLNKLQTFKGIFFVILTCIALYFIIFYVIRSLVKRHNLLVKSEEFYSNLFNNGKLPFLIIDPDSGYIHKANNAALDFYKYSLDEITSLKLSQINMLPLKELTLKINDSLNEQQNFFEFKHKLSTGEIKDVEVFSGAINLSNKTYLYSLITDVTDRNLSKNKLRESDQKFNMFANYLEAGLFIKKLDGSYYYANKYVESIIGEKNLENKYFKDFMSNEETELTDYYDKKSLAEGKISYEQEFTDCNNNPRIFKCLKFPIYRTNEEPLIGGINFDVTDYKLAESKIKDLAFTDIITGLKNFNYLKENFNKIEDKNNLAIIFIKITNLLEPSEILGDAFEIKLIQDFAERLKFILKEKDSLIYFGKYEYIIMINPNTLEESIESFSRKIESLIISPFIVDNYEITLNCKIGININENNDIDLSTLISKARMAITKKTYLDSASIYYYTKELDAEVKKQFDLEYELSQAIYNDELSLAYQPIVNTLTEKTFKTEALLRWNNKSFGTVPPFEFIPIAEKSNLILSIGEWVLRNACLQINEWISQGIEPLIISVNISARQMEQNNFLNLIENILKETSVNPKFLEFEITESMAIKDTTNTYKILNFLHELGISISIDDFGTGYSSLSQIKKLPVDTLKIDRSFIKDINENLDSNTMVSAILSIAKNLNLRVVAEGVETLDQFEYLRKNNCDFIQGYLFSRPIFINDFNDFITKPTAFHKKVLKLKENIDKQEYFKYIQPFVENTNSNQISALGYYSLNGEGAFIESNRIFQDMLGYSWSELEGKPLQRFLSDSDVVSCTRKISSKTKNMNCIIQFKQKNNSPLWVEVDAEKFFNENNELVKIICLVKDLSLGYNLVKSNFEKRKLYELIFDKAPLAFIKWNTNFIVEEWNNYATKIFGYSLEEALGKNLLKLIIKDMDFKKALHVSNKLFTGIPISNKFYCKTKSGEEIFTEWYYELLYNDIGEVDGILSITKKIDNV